MIEIQRPSDASIAVLRYGFESVMDMTESEFQEIFGIPKIDADTELFVFLKTLEASSDQ